MSGTTDQWIARQSRRRLRGKIVPPAVRAVTRRIGEGVWFAPYPVTTPYGATGNPAWSLGRHTGEDHAAPVGALACSTTWGEVICIARWLSPHNMRTDPDSKIAHWGDAYGTHVVIRTGDGRFDYALCHLSSVSVWVGQHVRPGQTIGRVGHTGGDGTFGAHLHLEARPAGGRFGSDIHPRNVKRLDRDRVW